MCLMFALIFLMVLGFDVCFDFLNGVGICVDVCGVVCVA